MKTEATLYHEDETTYIRIPQVESHKFVEPLVARKYFGKDCIYQISALPEIKWQVRQIDEDDIKAINEGSKSSYGSETGRSDFIRPTKETIHDQLHRVFEEQNLNDITKPALKEPWEQYESKESRN